MTVRIASMDDRDGMLALLDLMHAENGVASLCRPKMESALDRGLRRDRALIGVVGEPNDIRASIGLFLHQWWYSNDWHAEDCWNFVHPQHRKSTHAKELLTFAKKAADDLGIQLLIGVLSTERTQAKVKLYERFFGPSAGAGFVYPRPVRVAAE
jgi:GNAT superfamily N-acetyltransferase